MTPEQVENLENLNPFQAHLFSSSDDAFEWMNLCNEVQAELEQHLQLLANDSGDLIPHKTAELIQRIQAHCLECFNLQERIHKELNNKKSL